MRATAAIGYPLLCILNPRCIKRCLDAFDRLEIDKAWLTSFTECALVPTFAQLVDQTDYSHYVVVSDDAVVTHGALSAVLSLLEANPVATGYSNLDEVSEFVNLTKSPLRGSEPADGAYDFYTLGEVRSWPDEVVPTFFAGMSLTGMSRELWREFPFGCYGVGQGNGSDFHLCKRLETAGVPIVAARDGFVFHTKRTQYVPGDNEHQLFLDPAKSVVRMDRQCVS